MCSFSRAGKENSRIHNVGDDVHVVAVVRRRGPYKRAGGRALLLWLLLSFTAEIHASHLVTLEDLKSLGTLDVTMDLSPDGQTLAYALGSDSVNLMATKTGASVRSLGAGFLPRWSGVGDKVAFYSLRSGDVQLWVFDVPTQRSSQVTFVPGGIDPDPTTRVQGRVHEAFRFDWSPDGRSLVFASRVPDGKGVANDGTSMRPALSLPTPGEPLVLTGTTPIDWTLSGIFAHGAESAGLAESKDGHTITMKKDSNPGVGLRNQLFVTDISSHVLNEVSPKGASYFNPAWSPDGKFILCSSAGSGGPVFGARSIGVYKLEVSSGQVTALTQGTGIESRPTWSPDGTRIAFLGSKTLYGQSSVYVGAVNSDELSSLTSNLHRNAERFVWGQDGNSMLISYRDGVSTRLARFAADTHEMAKLASVASVGELLSVGELTVSKSGAIAWEQSEPGYPGTIRYQALGNAKPIVLVDLYPQIRAWRLGRVEVVHWRNQQGFRLEGTLLLPADYHAGRKYPMIVDTYPLMSGTDWQNPMFGNQAWASSGYVVFRPSAPAPHAWMNPWKTSASSVAAKGSAGWNVTVDDVLSGVNFVVAQGMVDPDRICLYGFSNGGGVADYLVTRTNRFKCAVSVAGALSDWVRPSLLKSDGASWLASWAGASIWDDPTSYVELSAVLKLRTVVTPMLLADGDDDGDFLLNSIEMYNGLRYLGVDVTLLRYPGQAHGFNGPSLDNFWDREMRFFAKYLKPGPVDAYGAPGRPASPLHP